MMHLREIVMVDPVSRFALWTMQQAGLDDSEIVNIAVIVMECLFQVLLLIILVEM